MWSKVSSGAFFRGNKDSTEDCICLVDRTSRLDLDITCSSGYIRSAEVDSLQFSHGRDERVSEQKERYKKYICEEFETSELSERRNECTFLIAKIYIKWSLHKNYL